jgi:hypothetical protein
MKRFILIVLLIFSFLSAYCSSVKITIISVTTGIILYSKIYENAFISYDKGMILVFGQENLKKIAIYTSAINGVIIAEQFK